MATNNMEQTSNVNNDIEQPQPMNIATKPEGPVVANNSEQKTNKTMWYVIGGIAVLILIIIIIVVVSNNGSSDSDTSSTTTAGSSDGSSTTITYTGPSGSDTDTDTDTNTGVTVTCGDGVTDLCTSQLDCCVGYHCAHTGYCWSGNSCQYKGWDCNFSTDCCYPYYCDLFSGTCQIF